MPDQNPSDPELPKPPQWLTFLGTPEGARAAEPIARAYVTLFNRFPKVTCFLSGMAVMAFIAARRNAGDDG